MTITAYCPNCEREVELKAGKCIHCNSEHVFAPKQMDKPKMEPMRVINPNDIYKEANRIVGVLDLNRSEGLPIETVAALGLIYVRISISSGVVALGMLLENIIALWQLAAGGVDEGRQDH